MVVSFACSVSNKVHKSHHAGKGSEIQSHNHKGTHRHNHESNHNVNHHTGHKHNDEAGHKHSHDNNNGNKEGEDDNCCSSDVIKLQQSDRSISKSIDLPEHTSHPVVHDIFLCIDHYLLVITKDNFLPQHLRWAPATIPDIRIAIQSFQI